jgi:iron complex outermembrane receptor protein
MIMSKSFRLALVSGTAFAALSAVPGAAFAQTAPPQEETTQPAATPTGAETPRSGANITASEPEGNEIIITGSRIKQDPNRSALPLQIVTTQELQRNGISSPEQLIMYLSTNGTGADNLASNADVTSGAQRGTNGLSAANLRGQGSAIYGTDAIGGVINFITKKDFEGVSLSGFTDITELGDSPIYRVSATAGYGDLRNQGFNIMGAVSKSWNGALFGRSRDFVNGNQPQRGLSIDTRGTPIATAFPINPTAAGVGITQGGTLLGGTGGNALAGLVIPGTTQRADAGINILNLPGGAGCGTFDGGMPYDFELYQIPGARFACAYDTGRAAVIQQPIETLTYYGRGTARLGDHEMFAEVTGSDATSAKRFSEGQFSSNNTSLPIAYPLNALTADTYNSVFNQLVAVFPAIAANKGKPITFRYRCIPCGNREYTTDTETFRGAVGAEGPLFGGFDYRVGASYAKSESASLLGTGYYFRGVFPSAAAATGSGIPGAAVGRADPRAPTAPGATAPGIVGLFNSGILNPFSLTQTPQALAALAAVSAEGTTLYGGRYQVKQVDASVAGDLFRLPAGDVQIALGVDFRRETYSFNGSAAAAADQPEIFLAAFDNVNALTPKHRNVKAAYGEILIPIFEQLEITAAARIDDYSGFGTTTNPKVTAKFRPFDWLMFRGSYNTGFRVPTFNQIFNGTTISPNPGNVRVDPTTCPSGKVDANIPGCAAITPDSLSGGNLNLGPETSKQYTVGVVFQPMPRFSASLDYWNIAVDDTIGSLTIDQLLNNQSFFPERVQRTNGIITGLDLRNDNIGSRRTEGLEVVLRGGIDAFGGQLTAGLDGTRLLKKRERFLPSQPFGPSLLGVFTFTGDLGLKWKHNAFVNWANEDVAVSLTQIFRSGYKNQQISAAAAARPLFNPRVDEYIIYHASVSYLGLGPNYRLTLGVKNLFDTDPPFAITYDSNTGAGSSWEPRVADPRGRSFTVAAEVRF